MSNPIELVLIIALIAYVLIRRMAGQPAQGKKLLVLPAVIMVIGFLSLSHTWSPLAVGFLVATTAISFVIGILRGVSIKLFEKDGVVWMRYTGTTVVLWVANILIKVAAAFAIAVINPTAAHQESSGLLISLGMGVLMEGVVVANKALHTDSRVLWAKGKDGEADRHSDFLDTIQRSRRG
jgi:membrane protein CcdC involved in cytochrome C biogenesis